MARISHADARRLGIIAPGPNASPKKTQPATVPGTKRRSAKGGRISRALASHLFEVKFSVPLEPKTKERPRTQISKPEIERAFMSANGSIQRFRELLSHIKHRTYTPSDTEYFEQAVAALAGMAMRGKAPYESPVHVDLIFSMTGDPSDWPTDVTDPDLDNMVKAVLDALNKVVLKDDRLVVSKREVKVCAAQPSILVRVRDAASCTAEIQAILDQV